MAEEPTIKGSNVKGGDDKSTSPMVPAIYLDPDQCLKLFASDRMSFLKTSVGGLIIGLSFVVLFGFPIVMPACFVLWAITQGYLLKLSRECFSGKQESLPDWSDWLELTIAGLTWFAISSVYMFFTVSAATVLLLLGTKLGWTHAGQKTWLVWSIGSFLIVFLSSMAISFASAYLMVNFGKEERISAAFNVKLFIERLKRHPLILIQGWCISTGLQWMSVVGPLASVIGAVFVPSTWFAAQIIGTLVMAQAWSRSAGPDDVKPVETVA